MKRKYTITVDDRGYTVVFDSKFMSLNFDPVATLEQALAIITDQESLESEAK